MSRVSMDDKGKSESRARVIQERIFLLENPVLVELPLINLMPMPRQIDVTRLKEGRYKYEGMVAARCPKCGKTGLEQRRQAETRYLHKGEEKGRTVYWQEYCDVKKAPPTPPTI